MVRGLRAGARVVAGLEMDVRRGLPRVRTRVSRTHAPGGQASKASSKYETRFGPFSYELYPGNVSRRGPMLGSPFFDPSKTFVITFMAEDVPWLLDGPPWDMPSESTSDSGAR